MYENYHTGMYGFIIRKAGGGGGREIIMLMREGVLST